jgi:hypothetical protein
MQYLRLPKRFSGAANRNCWRRAKRQFEKPQKKLIGLQFEVKMGHETGFRPVILCKTR